MAKQQGFEALAIQSMLYTQEKPAKLGEVFRQLTIGIPTENQLHENRVCLTPKSVEVLVSNGHKIIVQAGAGLASGYSDHEYSECGAQISTSEKEVFESNIVLKVAPPTDHELHYFQPNTTLLSAVQLSSLKPEYIQKLNAKRVNAVAFEFIEDKGGLKPIVRSMSEIAGVCIISIAGEYLSKSQKGQGIIFGGVTGVPPVKVVIIGAGTIGESVARIARSLGAEVQVYDHHHYKLRRMKKDLGDQVYTSIIDNHTLSKEIMDADVVVGALRSDEFSPIIVTDQMVSKMQPNSLIIDASISQGGCVETSRVTTHENPTFLKHDIVHYCVPNIASRTPRTATKAFSYIFTPMLLQIGRIGGIETMMRCKPWFRKGVYSYRGNLTNHSIGRKFALPVTDLEILMASF